MGGGNHPSDYVVFGVGCFDVEDTVKWRKIRQKSIELSRCLVCLLSNICYTMSYVVSLFLR